MIEGYEDFRRVPQPLKSDGPFWSPGAISLLAGAFVAGFVGAKFVRWVLA